MLEDYLIQPSEFVSSLQAHYNLNLTPEPQRLSVQRTLTLKDKILLPDWAYQELCGTLDALPSLNKVKKERSDVNANIHKLLDVKTGPGIIYCDPVRVMSLIKQTHNTTQYKITFDHRKNEGRDETLLALIPGSPTTITHCPTAIYPVMIYVGKEEMLKEKAKGVFQTLNNALNSHDDVQVQVLVSTDLKCTYLRDIYLNFLAFWTMTDMAFRVESDCFCPYCYITKGSIEAHLRGKLVPIQRTSGTFGALSISIRLFIYCFLHAKLRLTETLLRHQIRGYYDRATNKQKALQTFQTLLRRITGNDSIKVNVAQKKKDERKFGDVHGLTGGMVDSILEAWEELGKLAPASRIEDTQGMCHLHKATDESL